MDTTTTTPLHERLRIAAGSRTYRQLGDLTTTNHETVRRYMLGQAPSADFLAATCAALDINAQWLLVGRGPMKGTDIRSHALGEANVSELLSAMSSTLERLMDRVDRLETYMQTLETHLRAQAGAQDSRQISEASEPVGAKNHPLPEAITPARGSHRGAASFIEGTGRKIARVAGVVAKRSRSDAG